LFEMIAPILVAAAVIVPTSQSQQQLSVRPFAQGLTPLTAIASTPAEPRRLYAVEQVGRIRYFVGGRLHGTFLDLRSRVQSGGEQGLLSLAFHPNYRENHRFYVNYTDRRGDTRVIEFRSRNGVAIKSSARQLLFVHQPYANHNGGELQFGPDGLLYVGMGDGGSEGDPENRAQNMNDRLGKLLRIDPLQRGARWQIVGLGLRNPWRFSFDPRNGDLYIADVGQNTWEEIDYRAHGDIPTLANYGWKVYEGRARFSNTALGPGQLVMPVYVYGHEGGNCSVTGGYVYRGSAVPAATGRYFFGDYCSGVVWSLTIDAGRAVSVRREPVRVPSLTSFGEDAAGELYFATGTGRIFRLSS
jgi:glucose/arabinose dehydrogenase